MRIRSSWLGMKRCMLVAAMSSLHMELICSGITDRILSCVLAVHSALGPGLLESAYRRCLARQMECEGLAFREEVSIPIEFRGMKVDAAYRADLIVEELVLVELKAIDRLLRIHEAQILTYLKLSGLHVGLLIDFNSTSLRHGIRRLVR